MSRVKVKESRVVITGAGSGIGRATALRCAGKGAEVWALDIDADSAAATAEECAGHARVCDVADAAAVEALAAEIWDDHGPVDLMVNNAGVGVAGPFLDNTLEDWEWLRSINLDGVVHGCRSFGGRMVDRGHGHVVNIASGAGYIPSRQLATYCATKSAVIMLSQCLRGDWAGDGVGVSVICPGVINTPIARNSRLVGRMEGKTDRAARAMRFGHSPDAVAKAIVNAAEKNHGIVPVGIESEFGFRVLRFVPDPVQKLMTRAEVL